MCSLLEDYVQIKLYNLKYLYEREEHIINSNQLKT